MAPAAREYQDGESYQLPKDATEHDRLDAQSASIVALMNDQPVHAPLSEPKKILDVGCGTGSMTNLLASLYPGAKVIGVDIAPVPEGRHEKLPNMEYVQGDIRQLVGKDPRFEPGSFDYIFERLLVYGITSWPDYLASLTSLLKPGGWLEVHETSMQGRSASDEKLDEKMWYYRIFRSDAAALGLDVEVGDKIVSLLQSTSGLDSVSDTCYKFAPKPSKDRPRLAAFEGQLEVLSALVVRKVCTANGRGEEEIDKLLENLHSMWENGFEEGDHCRFYAAIAQKNGES